MKNIVFSIFLGSLLVTGCQHISQEDYHPLLDSSSDSDSLGDSAGGNFSGVDMIIMVDNSSSMGEEQSILSMDLYQMVKRLIEGDVASPIDDLRIAVVSSDIGLAWGGSGYTFGDGWPGGSPPDGCSSYGDRGKFVSDYMNGGQMLLDDEVITCPSSPGSLGEGWIENSEEMSSENVALTAGCLANLGTNGCGFEQQLESMAQSLVREDQQSFVRDEKLLVLMAVTDEGDCSIQDGPALFSSPEVQDSVKWNIACGANPEFLFTVEHYAEFFSETKGGAPNSVLFAGIVGVPIVEECQGSGSEISECLSHPDMQLTERIEINSQGTGIYYWEYACENGGLTKAYPGRRFVELAQAKGDMGYIYSICNNDWIEAMDAISEKIADHISPE